MIRRLTILLLLFPAVALAQGTAADYERAAAMRGDLQKLVTRDQIRPQWQEGKLYYHVRTGPDLEELVRVDPADGQRTVITREEMPPAPPQEERRGPRRRPRGSDGLPGTLSLKWTPISGHADAKLSYRGGVRSV